MIMNMDSESNQHRFKPVGGIGLYKISYEMDVKGSSDHPQYTAGIVAYSNEEALKTLTDFCNSNVKGFKGLKIQEMAFEGLCHSISNKVKKAIVGGAINEGKVVSAQIHKEVLRQLEETVKKTSSTKKSIVKKSKE